MGSSASATMAKPLEGYTQAMQSGLDSSTSLTNAAIASPPELRSLDIDYMQNMARREALVNALESKNLERQVSPDVAALRESLPKQVNEEMSGGPSAQLSNFWLKSGLADTIATGVDAGSGFARSALADSTRRDYILDRDRIQGKASNILSANPMPVAGLDPGSLASHVARTNADNADARDVYKATILSALGNQSSNVMNAFQQAAQMEAARRSGNAQTANATAGANAASSNALTGSMIGAGGALAGGLLIF